MHLAAARDRKRAPYREEKKTSPGAAVSKQSLLDHSRKKAGTAHADLLSQEEASRSSSKNILRGILTVLPISQALVYRDRAAFRVLIVKKVRLGTGGVFFPGEGELGCIEAGG